MTLLHAIYSFFQNMSKARTAGIFARSGDYSSAIKLMDSK